MGLAEVTKRITLTFNDEEVDKIAELRDALDPERPLATFAADCLIANVEAELHGMECQCQHLAQVLYSWQPDGRPN